MSTLSTKSWAAGVAHRLKLIQANSADDDDATRRDFLSMELNHRLSEVGSKDREACLTELLAHFPDWTSQSSHSVNADLQKGTLGVNNAAATTADEALEQFLSLAERESEGQKSCYRDRLVSAGFVAVDATDKGESTNLEDASFGPEIRKQLGIKPGVRISQARIAKSMMELLDAALALEDFIWELWQSISSKPVMRARRQAEIRPLVRDYISSSDEVSLAKIREAIQLTRKVNVSLLGSLGPLANKIVREYHETLSPNAVVEAVAMEPKTISGRLKAPAVRNWEKYLELAKEWDESSMKLRVDKLFEKFVNELLEKQGRKQN